MRISDWSSDVCSSDLVAQFGELAVEACDLVVAPGQCVAEKNLGEDEDHQQEDDDHQQAGEGIHELWPDVDGGGARAPSAGADHTGGLSPPVFAYSGDRPGEELDLRWEEHTSELQSLMSISYAVLRLKKKKT